MVLAEPDTSLAGALVHVIADGGLSVFGFLTDVVHPDAIRNDRNTVDRCPSGRGRVITDQLEVPTEYSETKDHTDILGTTDLEDVNPPDVFVVGESHVPRQEEEVGTRLRRECPTFP